jgi:acetoin utilization deacetylase AcuC-like enzyme
MLTVFSTDHLLRSPRTELYGGELVRPHESPERAQIVLDRIRAQGLGEVIAPVKFGMVPLLRVHDPAFVEFLKQVWSDWVAAGNRGEAIPDCWPARRMAQRCPNSIVGKLGYYAMAAETSISQGTWEAAGAAADVALTAAWRLKDGARAAFALCRPPGHHAARDMYGGYCFLNNAAIAAQYLRDGGAARVAILDVDFHHGNGTQDIFYDRPDVLYVSLHGDPADAFPYFSGYADEIGTGAGAGFTLNLPMPPGTEFGYLAGCVAYGAGADRRFSRRRAGGVPGRRYLRRRSDQFLSPAIRGFLHVRADDSRLRPAHLVRHGRRLCRR